MSDAAATAPRPVVDRVRVWDLPTRVFHWVLAAAVVGSVVTAKIGGNAMAWHYRLGYLILGLLMFRLAWGLVGGRWARFASFVYGPASTLRYLRGRAHEGDRFDVGHSPLGALSVFALLLVLALQVGTGLVSFDDIEQVGGPLNRFVAEATATKALGWHKSAGQVLVISLVLLHVAAVLFYVLARRRDLIGPMWHGDKPLTDPSLAAADTRRERLVALAIALGCAALVGWVVSLGSA
jgi:cytochrome b